jgi:hypothetical protein
VRRETEDNYQALLRQRASLARHDGQYALMKAGMIVAFFPTSQSAMLAGGERFVDRLFSVHRIRMPEPNPPTRILRRVRQAG